jgi:TfoX N-terminal domain
MFGGIAFMVDGHMACGIVGHDLMVRLGKDDAAAGLEQPHTREMDFTGRPMTGMLFVEPAGLEDDALRTWARRAVAFVRTLPPRRRRDVTRSVRVQGATGAPGGRPTEPGRFRS